ncbi:hypothetical protein R1flu_020270 [Riccia fluitans]|uniref:Uncharacterized protein n=1 Tax=Riccia fluitans TaxID=41844 RepID=A0ABD1ZL07_9MARC
MCSTEDIVIVIFTCSRASKYYVEARAGGNTNGRGLILEGGLDRQACRQQVLRSQVHDSKNKENTGHAQIRLVN